MLTALALTLALAPNGGELAACQAEVRRLRAEGATAEVERRKRLSPHEQFALGNANPMAAAALAPAVDRLLGGSAAPAHTLECRTWACRLKVALTKEDERRVNGWMKGLQSDEELGERVAGIEFHAGTPGKDPLSGAAPFRAPRRRDHAPAGQRRGLRGRGEGAARADPAGEGRPASTPVSRRALRQGGPRAQADRRAARGHRQQVPRRHQHRARARVPRAGLPGTLGEGSPRLEPPALRRARVSRDGGRGALQSGDLLRDGPRAAGRRARL